MAAALKILDSRLQLACTILSSSRHRLCWTCWTCLKPLSDMLLIDTHIKYSGLVRNDPSKLCRLPCRNKNVVRSIAVTGGTVRPRFSRLCHWLVTYLLPRRKKPFPTEIEFDAQVGSKKCRLSHAVRYRTSSRGALHEPLLPHSDHGGVICTTHSFFKVPKAKETSSIFVPCNATALPSSSSHLVSSLTRRGARYATPNCFHALEPLPTMMLILPRTH